jgi:hypothetical protein
VPVIAHFGHWAISLIYLVPFAAVALWLVRDRMRHGGEEGPEESGEER